MLATLVARVLAFAYLVTGKREKQKAEKIMYIGMRVAKTGRNINI